MKFSKAFFNKLAQQDEEEEDFSHLPSAAVLKTLLPKLLEAAQNEYNDWHQDEEGMDDMLGAGGICQEIAGAFCSVLSSSGIDCTTVSAQIGEQHVWTVAKFAEGVYEIDIPPGVYETGGGYNWKKIPDVVFEENDLSVHCLSSSPNDFEKYCEE